MRDRADGDTGRLVLWNIDLTLVNVARVTRAAFAEAFAQVTGRPLVRLSPAAGRSESEVFFEALALNADASAADDAERILARYQAAVETALEARRDDLARDGQLLPGAAEAVAAVAALDGAVQTVLTGSFKANALLKLRAFGLDAFLDTSIGGYGEDPYPKGTLLRVTRQRAARTHPGWAFTERGTVYVADSPRDVDAARIGGARSLGVASGPASEAELRDAGADDVLPDLADTARLTSVITRLTGP